MAWWHQPSRHYLSQCWPRSMWPYGITRSHRLKYDVPFAGRGGWGCEVSCGGHHTALAKRKDHHGVSSEWSSTWFHSNTGLSSTQYEQIPIIFGVWPFWLTPLFLAVTKQLYEWFSPSVCPSVRLSVTPFWLCSHHRIIMKFSGVITSDGSDVRAKGQGQRSRSQRSQPNFTVSGL